MPMLHRDRVIYGSSTGAHVILGAQDSPAPSCCLWIDWHHTTSIISNPLLDWCLTDLSNVNTLNTWQQTSVFLDQARAQHQAGSPRALSGVENVL